MSRAARFLFKSDLIVGRAWARVPAMHEINEGPRRLLAAAVFWTIIGLIVYARFVH